ncbi:hypothetical protein [Lactococcus lactis]|jgi:uncharacterized membrane protein|uniref:hypothetical protein n=1 Tax=Lactococcus lactis TaxID=1358 RepID=UPI0022E60AF3|nr:hypothetical protein [Lactococcus lactis]MDA2898270.1 hypothetical protein [Lactococcus lactis]
MLGIKTFEEKEKLADYDKFAEDYNSLWEYAAILEEKVFKFDEACQNQAMEIILLKNELAKMKMTNKNLTIAK